MDNNLNYTEQKTLNNVDRNSHLELKPDFIWNWKDLLLIIIGIIGLLILGVIIFVAILFALGENLEMLQEPTITQVLMLTTLETIALTLGVYLFGMRRKHYSWSVVGIRSTTWVWIILSIGITMIMIPIVSLITLLILFLSGQSMENPQLDFLLPDGLTALNAIFMLLLVGFLAPFAEELLFRGVLYTFLRERWGIWVGVLVSSLIFGVMHGNLAVGVTGFLLGIVAALVFEYSKSLWPAVIVHVINNSLKVGLLYLLILFGFDV